MTVLAAAAALAPDAAAAPSTGHARKPFVPGSATGISQALQIAPRTGGLAATITVGRSIADYRDSLAQASSQTLDLGLIGTDLTVQCGSAPPTLRASQLPQPLVAESDRGNAHATKTTAGTTRSGALAAAGQESVRATTHPRSSAGFDGGSLVVPGLLTMSGMHSASHAMLVKGAARVATASSRVGQVKLLGGAIVLTGLEWQAERRSGTHANDRTAFTMQSATVAGRRLPTTRASLAATIATINAALADTGLQVSLPHRSRHQGTTTISPLSIGISNSKLGGAIVNPVLGALQPITDPLSQALTGADCRLGNVLTLADIALSAIDGTGGIAVELGGASAGGNGKTYGNPFGAGPPPPPGGAGGPSGIGGTTTTTAAAGGSGSLPASAGSGGAAASGSIPIVAGTTATSVSCASTSPAGGPSCSRGKGLMVGLVALGALGAFAAADFLALRRRRRAAR